MAAPRSIDSSTTAGRVLDALRVSRAPLTSAQLAERITLPTSKIRHHLRRLHESGLIQRTSATGPTKRRGRPAVAWQATAVAEPHLLARLASELAVPLGEMTALGSQSVRIRAFGGAIAAQSSAEDPLMDGLARLGFAPRSVSGSTRNRRIELGSCPFVADATGEVDNAGICRVHALVAVGLAAGRERVERLDVVPTGRSCMLHMRRATGGSDDRMPQVIVP